MSDLSAHRLFAGLLQPIGAIFFGDAMSERRYRNASPEPASGPAREVSARGVEVFRRNVERILRDMYRVAEDDASVATQERTLRWFVEQMER